MLTHGIPPEFRGGVHIFLPATHTIGSVPSLSGHAIACRLRSLPRVRWHRASSPQGSSSNGCCLCITMDRMLLCSSLFPHPLMIYSENVQIIGGGQSIQVSKYEYYCCSLLLYCLWNCFLFFPPTYRVQCTRYDIVICYTYFKTYQVVIIAIHQLWGGRCLPRRRPRTRYMPAIFNWRRASVVHSARKDCPNC